MVPYEVAIGVTVEAYATVKVKARSPKDAEARVNKAIKDGASFNFRVGFKPDWGTANGLRLIEGSSRETTRPD